MGTERLTCKLTVETWRLDTHELVRARAMTDEERARARQPRLRGLG